MLKTIRHNDSGREIVAAKLLMGALTISEKVKDPDAFISENQVFDATFVSKVCSWQGAHKLTADGVIGKKTWTAMAQAAPTCSTSKNYTSAATLALQILLDSNLTADGVFGSRTKKAVVALQSSMNLNVDGICGQKTWSAIICGTADTSTPETPAAANGFRQPVDYKQGDSRWGKLMYSNHGDKSQTMANSACGPTAMADIVATLKDKNVNPYDLAKLAMQWGDRTYSSGTAWSFFKHIADHFKFAKMVQSSGLAALKACLDAGGYVVCSMGAGYWTKGGHFICAWKYDSTYIYCNDPASSTRKKQDATDFMKQRKQFFCFYPDSEPEPVKEMENSTCCDDYCEIPGASEPTRGEKIVDISKYQANVDYDKLIGDTALIILRAGYKGTAGGIHEDQKFEEHAQALKDKNVPFGVYFYSIASDEAEAREEAQAFVNYASKYKPLFWAMDAEKAEITQGAVIAFADELRKQGAKKVGCYVAHHLYKQYDFADARNSFDFVWIPRYGKNDGTVEGSTEPAYSCDLWQFTSTGSVAGISGNVDLNKITAQGKPLSWFTGDGEA